MFDIIVLTKSMSFKFWFWGFGGGCRLAAPFFGSNPAETNIKQIIFKSLTVVYNNISNMCIYLNTATYD
jgi:hypothetical protein